MVRKRNLFGFFRKNKAGYGRTKIFFLFCIKIKLSPGHILNTETKYPVFMISVKKSGNNIT